MPKGIDTLWLAASIVSVATVFSTASIGQPARRVTLVAADPHVRENIDTNAPTLPADIDAKSIRVFVDGGPVSLCEKQGFGNPCLRILNRRIACELANCFPGAGDWRNRIRSVRFD